MKPAPARAADFVVAVLSACAMAACSDSTGPNSFVALNVIQVDGPTFYTAGDGTPRIECIASLNAVATSSRVVKWRDAVFRFYAGKMSQPTDTAIVPDSIVRDSWGQDTLGSKPEQAGWDVSSPVPFTLKIEYHYQPLSGGAVGSASVSFQCGSTTSADSSPPAIPNLTISQVTPPVQPGDTLTISYAATSSAGLWQTSVDLSGPCQLSQVFGENLRLADVRTVSIALPAACQLGVPITVTVIALDVALRQTVRSLATSIQLSDVTRPALVTELFPKRGLPVTTTLGGDYFTLDTMNLMVIASDNHALSTLVWQVDPAGTRDSIPLSGISVSQSLRIPIPPSWAGTFQLRLWAKDAAGNTSDTSASAVGAFHAYPTVARPTTSTTVPGDVNAIAFDQRRNVIYLLQPTMNRIAVLDPLSATVTATIAVPSYPVSFDLTLSSDSLIVARRDARVLGVVDLKNTPALVDTLHFALLDSLPAPQVNAVRIAANDMALIAVDSRLYTLDLSTGAWKTRGDAGNAGNVGVGTFLERSLDRSAVYVNGDQGAFQRYDATSDAFGPAGSAILTDHTPNVDATGSHVAVSVDLYDATLRRITRVQDFNATGYQVALTPDGASIFTSISPDGIVRSRVTDGVTLDRTLSPGQASYMRVSPDGGTLVVVRSGATSTISIISLQ
jgi:hypothetical protein